MEPTEHFRLWLLLRVLYDEGAVDPYWVVQVMKSLIRTKIGPHVIAEHLPGYHARLYMLLAVQGPTYLVQEWVDYFKVDLPWKKL